MPYVTELVVGSCVDIEDSLGKACKGAGVTPCPCSRRAVDGGSCGRQKKCGVRDALGMQLRVAPAGCYVIVY